MRDLRRQALESKKTVSKKAQSRVSSSRVSSRASSIPNSRNQSRQASDDEDDNDDNLSDSTNLSVNSTIDYMLNLDDLLDKTEEEESSWRLEIAERVEEIIDRKGSNVQSRETALTHYAHILMHNYAPEDIKHKTSELCSEFLRSIKAGDSEKETCLALRALVLTIVTVPSETIYDAVFSGLKSAYIASESHVVKALAIHSLSAAAVFGGASNVEIEEIMDELLEIVESDGSSVGADDSGAVVTAASEVWGLLATMLDDLEEKTDTAMDAFMEQLESSEITVQVAAGENIALLYENRCLGGESEEESDSEGESNGAPSSTRSNLVNFRQQNQLEEILTQLATESSRRISKRDRKTLHTNFTDILKTVEDPSRGPRYSTAIDNEKGREYGSRMTVDVGKIGRMTIDRWWKLHRLQGLRRILGAGFLIHYQKNEVVFDNLPIIIWNEDTKTYGNEKNSSKPKDKKKNGSRAKGRQQFIA